MRDEIKKELDELAQKHLSNANINTAVDHNGGGLRIAVDVYDVPEKESDAFEGAIKGKYPNAKVFVFVN